MKTQSKRWVGRRGGALRVALVAGLVVAVSGGALAWWAGVGRDSESTRRTGLDLADSEKMSFDITTAASGELEAKNQIEIRNKLETPATIAEVVAEGTRVKAGDLLVRLNVDQIKQVLDQAKVEIENVKAGVEASQHAYEIQVIENEQKLRQAQLKVELAGLDRLQWLEGEAKSKRQANSLALSKSQLEVERLAEKLQQSSGLLEKGFLSKDEYDRDQVAYIEAQSAWITSKLQNEVFELYEFRKQEKKFESDVEEAKAELEEAMLNNSIQLAAKNADRAAKKRVFDLQDEQVKKHELSIVNATIKAPSDGLVVYASSMSRNMWFGGGDGPIAIGRQVMPNETIMMLPDTSEMVAMVRVPETLASRVSKGQTATIKVDAAGGKSFQGVVESIGVLAESGGWRDQNLKEYTVKISIDKSQAEGLKPSMRCESRIFLDRVTDVTSVPVQAVFSDGPVRFVHVREGARYVRRPVNLGRQSDTHAEIVGGLEEGAKVLTREPVPAELLARDWDRVQLEAAGYDIGQDGKPSRREKKRERGVAAGSKKSEQAAPATVATEEKPGADDAGTSKVDAQPETESSSTVSTTPAK